MLESIWVNEFYQNIYLVKQETSEKIKGTIGFVHGVGEHIGRYKHVFDFFTSNGFICYGFDSFGHGKSFGKRGHIYSLEQWMNEIRMLTTWMKEEHPTKPVILYGHSLGGNKVLNYTFRESILPDLTIATSPFIDEGVPSPKAKIIVGRILSKLIPSLQIDNGLEKNALSHDQKVNDNYKHDPLVHSKVSLGLGAISLDAAAWLKNGNHVTSIPMLITHGDQDRLTDYSSSKEFVEKVRGDIYFKTWHGHYHETHNEVWKQDVFNYTLDWINKQLFS